MTWRFEPEEELGAAFRRVALEELAKVQSALRSGGAAQDVAIHEARRSFKKLRALARLARPSLGAAFRAENARWRNAGRLLSAARDAAVLSQTFESVTKACGDDLPPDGVAALRDAIDGTGGSGDGAVASPPVDEVLRIVDLAAAEMGSLQWPQTRKDVFRALRDSQDRLRRSWKAARNDGSSEALHEWRKRVKDFAAQTSLFKAGLSGELKAHRRSAKELAEVLGTEHDLSILAEKLAAVPAHPQGIRSRDHILACIDERQDELRRDAFAKGDELSARRGKAFAHALVTNWELAAADRAGTAAVHQRDAGLP